MMNSNSGNRFYTVQYPDGSYPSSEGDGITDNRYQARAMTYDHAALFVARSNGRVRMVLLPKTRIEAGKARQRAF